MNLKFGHGLVLVVLLAIVPLFAHLDHKPLQQWDEARLANSALEMLQNRSFLVPTYDGLPDMWSTKPPLLIWIQAACFACFGYSELALRLPSAIAALFTCILLYWFFARKLKRPWIGLFTVAILVSSAGYVSTHGTRTGDYDSLVVLFITSYTLSFFLYLESGHRKWLSLFFTCLILTCLTKGIAGLLPGPALLIYGLTRKQTLGMLKAPTFYAGIFALLTIVGGYYLLREHYNPGYLHAVQQNELGGRYLTTLEHHEADNWFYWDLLIDQHFSNWYLLVPCGIVTGLLAKDEILKRLTVFIGLSCICYLIIISTAATKLTWYDMPLFPFLAILGALALWLMFRSLTEATNLSSDLRLNPLPLLVVALIIFKPYRDVVHANVNPFADPTISWEDNIGYFLKENLSGSRHDSTILVCTRGQAQHVKWYLKALRTKDRKIDFILPENLENGQRVVIYEPEIEEYVTRHYEDQLLEDVAGVHVVRIGRKQETAKVR